MGLVYHFKTNKMLNIVRAIFNHLLRQYKFESKNQNIIHQVPTTLDNEQSRSIKLTSVLLCLDTFVSILWKLLMPSA